MQFITYHSWQLIALAELLFILFLLLKLKKKKEVSPSELEALKTSKKTKLDMNNLMNDIHLSKELYRELSRQCHPDRFAGTELVDQANNLFQEIQQSQNNYQQLCLLRDKVMTELKLERI